LKIPQNIFILTLEVRDYQSCDLGNVKLCGLVDKHASIKVHGIAFQSTVTLILL
jgi:hypothetical protein